MSGAATRSEQLVEEEVQHELEVTSPETLAIWSLDKQRQDQYLIKVS